MYKIAKPLSFKATLGDIQNLGDIKSYQLVSSEPLKSKWPNNVTIPISPIDPNYPDYGEELTDYMVAESSLVVISENLKNELSKIIDDNKLEFLPVKILKRDGSEVNSSFFLLNVLNQSEIINEEETIAQRNLLKPGQLSLVSKLVLDQKKPDENSLIFRTHLLPYLIFMKDELITQINTKFPDSIEIVEEQSYRS